jgi:hypothetical protein
MHVSRETADQTDIRLRQVIAQADVDWQPGLWWFQEFAAAAFESRLRADALAVVRDGEQWSQLVPVREHDAPAERLRVWCFHFPTGLDNSGFVGWLATQIKRATGSGVLVVCGYNGGRGGVFDYWACPAAIEAPVRELLAQLRQRGVLRAEQAGRLDGVRMRAAAATPNGVVDADTVFEFAQQGDVVSAHYAGGSIQVGYLVGQLRENQLQFRYAQVDRNGRVDSGHSLGALEMLPDGRLQLTEWFQWDSRDGGGTNVFRQA